MTWYKRFACNQKICTNNFFTIIPEGGFQTFSWNLTMRRRVSLVVYICSKRLHLTVGSCDLSEAEKKITIKWLSKFTMWQLFSLETVLGEKKLSFWVKIVAILWTCSTLPKVSTTIFFSLSQHEINHMSWQSTEVC